jgi:transcriptional regulator with XRE-family HTH domain
MKKIAKVTIIKKRRISLGFSQKALADKVKLAISSIGGFERGENPISDEIANELSIVLGMKKESLFIPHKKLKNKWIAK